MGKSSGPARPDNRSHGEASMIGNGNSVPGLSSLWQSLRLGWFGGYRPERHYMRGPGPACARRSVQL